MTDDLLRVFVYGTLKRGQRNHARYCRGAVEIEPACVLGRLHFLAAGYPMLEVPAASVLAVGTSHALTDLGTQMRSGEQTGGRDVPANDDWEPIEGEIISFADDLSVLSRLDHLEDFRPGDSASTYLRVLVPLLSGSTQVAWTYVAPDGRLPISSRRIGTHWP